MIGFFWPYQIIRKKLAGDHPDQFLVLCVEKRNTPTLVVAVPLPLAKQQGREEKREEEMEGGGRERRRWREEEIEGGHVKEMVILHATTVGVEAR